ncbi:MAG: GTP-binding protein [Candidatus Dormibacteraeota bacterium]|nr:GTP-binding protein [Candidatus Dormibacteraeota bacterium]
MSDARANRCPVTVIGGFLGSGKTTLLRRVLADEGSKGIAVVINEFGEVALDHHLVRQVGEQTVLVSGGCVCCNRRDDLVRVMRDLLDLDERGPIRKLRRVLIETSGLADPAPILFTLVTDPVLQHHFFVDSIMATVDAVNGQLQLDLHEESRKQATVADQLVLTKVDMAEPDELEKLVHRLRTINPMARITSAVFGEVAEGRLFGDCNGVGARIPAQPTCELHLSNGNSPPAETRSLSLSFHQPLDWVAFTIWLSMLLHARGEDVLRVKGLINAREVGAVVLNGVQHVLHPPEHLERWPAEDESSRLVFITRKLDPQSIVRSLNAFQCLGGGQPVDANVSN